MKNAIINVLEKLNNKNENRFAEKNADTKYVRFALVYDGISERPVFIKEEKHKSTAEDGTNFEYTTESFDVPTSPALLGFCTAHLTKAAKAKEAENIEGFKFKCRKIKSQSPSLLHLDEEWDKIIEQLSYALCRKDEVVEVTVDGE